MSGSCQHLEGLRVSRESKYLCQLCGAEFGAGEVVRWVREAEEARDATYSKVEGDEFDEISREESQREVYRRRKVMYELQRGPRIETARPEMVLVTWDPNADSYDCRVFYKEPRPEHGMDRFSVVSETSAILELRSDPSLAVRLAAGKIEEFHRLRERSLRDGEPAPERRVFYASEL